VKIHPRTRKPDGASDDWLDEGVRYDAGSWQVLAGPAGVEWTGESGITWTVGVACHRETLAPGVATLKARSSGAGPNLEAVVDPARSVGMFAVAMATQIVFGSQVDPVSFPLLPLFETCRKTGKKWDYYVARVMASDRRGISAEVVARSGAPDYRDVAIEYLAAVDAGEDPRRRLVSRLGCPSPATAGTWISRAGKQGWLTVAQPVPGARRGPGPRLLTER